MKTLITCILFTLFLAPGVSAVSIMTEYEAMNHLPLNKGILPKNEDIKPANIQEKIKLEAVKSGVNPDKALKIAFCESSFNPKSKHKISSAKGLFMFINKTWINYCEGDVFNEDDNIACFMKLYPKNPEWWECDKLI